MTQAFAGIRIIDFTQVLAGPYGVMQLALLGADVIKVEQPGVGDQTRGLMNADNDDGMSPSFMTCNVNKRSLTLNLKAAGARDIIERLVASADVVVENFKAGTMGRLGFDYEALRNIKPDLIYCAVTGYGQTGPKAGVAAYDGAIQASSGMMSQNGHPETGPTRTGFMPVDMATSLNTAFAISAALFRRAATGEGQFIDVAMMDTAIVAQAAQYSNYLNAGNLVGLNGNASPTRQPTADVFPTGDGFIQITALRDNQIQGMFRVMGCADKLLEAPFRNSTERVANPAEIKAFVAHELRRNTTDHWIAEMSAAGVPVAEVRTLPEVVDDEQLKLRGVFERLPSPLDNGEEITVVKAGYMTNADGPTIRSGPPRVGEHTLHILAELGFDDAAISHFTDSGTI